MELQIRFSEIDYRYIRTMTSPPSQHIRTYVTVCSVSSYEAVKFPKVHDRAHFRFVFLLNC